MIVDIIVERNYYYAYLCRKMCIEKYGVAPEVKVTGHTVTVFPYIMSPLDYILHEILKNSMRYYILRRERKKELTENI